jgi:hypothetical protein
VGPHIWYVQPVVLPGRLDPCQTQSLGPRDGEAHLEWKSALGLDNFPFTVIEPERRPLMRIVLFLLACYTTVVGTLFLITIVVMVSDAVAAPGLARDVMAVLGGHLAALGGSVWYRRCTRRSSTASSIRPVQ